MDLSSISDVTKYSRLFPFIFSNQKFASFTAYFALEVTKPFELYVILHFLHQVDSLNL